MTEPALEPGRATGQARLEMDAAAAATVGASVLAARHGARDYGVRRLLAASDVVALSFSLAVGLTLFSGTAGWGDIAWGLVTLPAWVVIFKLYGLYERDVKRISHTSVDDLPWIFHAALVGSLLLWVFYRAVPDIDLGVVPIIGFGALTMVTVPVARSVTRRATSMMLGPERVLLMGDGPTIPALVRKMRSHPEYGLEPVGVVTLPDSRGQEYSAPVVGDLANLDLQELADRHRVDRVVVSHHHLDEPAMFEVMRRCRELSLKVSVLPQLFDAMGPSVEVDDVEGITVLGVNPAVLSRSSRLIKRAMDLIGASILLLLALPVMVIVAVAIRLDSRGPVFFRQERIGKLGRRFRLVKFRTMVTGAEELRADLLAESTDAGWLLLNGDPRVTRVGRVLRLTSLDELPQLWNVVKGEMSLVGPRPLIESEDRQLTGWTRARIDLTPGLTGLWQVLGRTNISFEEMVKLDYLYVTNWSLWTDIRLLLRTFPAVLGRRGAN